jgi:hypothetical protein
MQRRSPCPGRLATARRPAGAPPGHMPGGRRDRATATDPAWATGQALGTAKASQVTRAVQLLPDGRDDPAQVLEGPDKGAAGGAEPVGDRDLLVAVALGQQVQGEDLGVVVVVADHRGGRGAAGQGPGLPLAAGWLTAAFLAVRMHGWWWPGRHTVAALAGAVLAIAWWAGTHNPPRATLRWIAMVGVVGYAWLLVEGTAGHHTWVAGFWRTTYPPYQLWRLALPDFKHLTAGTWLLGAGWLAVLAFLAIRSWRSPPPAPQPPSRATTNPPPARRLIHRGGNRVIHWITRADQVVPSPARPFPGPHQQRCQLGRERHVGMPPLPIYMCDSRRTPGSSPAGRRRPGPLLRCEPRP